MTPTTHNLFDESHWASCLRENLTSSSYGEGLETDRILSAPRQSLTRQRHGFRSPAQRRRDYYAEARPLAA